MAAPTSQWLAQLEPDAVIAAWMVHPPEDFTVAPLAGAPAFIALFDILTTLDSAARDRLQRVPGFVSWSRWLRWRTQFLGCTASEYALLPRAGDPADVVASLLQQSDSRASLLIVKDLARESPLLETHDNVRCADFIRVLEAKGFVLLEGMPLAWVALDFADEDEYLSRMSRSRRRDIRRKLRSRDALEVDVLGCGDPLFDDERELDAIHTLYRNVHAQSKVHFDLLTRDYFAALLRDHGNGGLLFRYRHQGELIGWNLCFVHGDALIDKYVGFAYPQAREHNLYAVSWMENLHHARTMGLRRYIAGWTDTEVKRQLGAGFTMTWHAVRPRNALLRAALQRMRHLFEAAPP